MNQQQPEIPEDLAKEVLEVASRMAFETAEEGYSLAELQEAGQEVSIPPEIMEKALQKVQEKHRQAEIELQEKQKTRKLIQQISIGVVSAIALWGIITYNSLLNEANKVNAAWAQVENQIQRKADLIPQLISLTQAQSQQELRLIELLNETYNNYQNANSRSEKEAVLIQVNQAIESFNQYVLNQPHLQSSQIFINLQYEIAGTENRIATERMRYNQAVTNFNSQVQSFPNRIIANLAGLEKQAFFQAQK
jgi:LemA protein